MIEKVLIANRGEIALRIVRACRDLGVASVAAYSEADGALRFVRAADEAVLLGPAPAAKSYLDVDRIVEAARGCGADAVHPGYGFLAENPRLARAVRDAGLTFIGPDAEAIEAFGSKLGTRALMAQAGVPVAPGTEAASEIAQARQQAEAIGYPLLVKPSGGGGGRGMRLVGDPQELEQALQRGRREAAQSFGDSDVYLEKVITPARHIEVQVLADAKGNLVHLGSRDCSLQRRHQKLVEEALAPALTPDQQELVCSLALRAMGARPYQNAATVEFLYDGQDNFYLLEVNTRIQVEHPVTEQVYGLDLVAEQIRIAGGEPLSVTQQDLRPTGCAIECRIYAEDPERSFFPSPGTITGGEFPAGPWVREDRAYEIGDKITPFYDGMISKLIAWGPTRESATRRLRRALSEYRIEGPKTNLEFLRRVLSSEAFSAVAYDTGYIEREFA